MNIAPILAASLPIQVHLASTVAAFVLGTIVLLRRKGTGAHRAIGWVYVTLLLVASGSSLLITEIFPGRFSPIHVLSLVTPLGLAAAIYAIRRGNVYWHRRAMLMVYGGGLIVAGFFTFLPNRTLGQMLFGS